MGNEREEVGDSGFCVRSNLTAHVLNLSPYTLAQCSRV